jgi:hypothetical protein
MDSNRLLECAKRIFTLLEIRFFQKIGFLDDKDTQALIYRMDENRLRFLEIRFFGKIGFLDYKLPS